jgi:hypothetical protein
MVGVSSARATVVSTLLGCALACNVVEDAPAPDRAPRPVAGERVPAPPDATPTGSEQHCELTATAPSRIVAGENSKITVSMQPRDGYKINQEAPLEVRVSSSGLEQGRYSIDDATVLASEAVHMEIPFSAHAPGEHRLEVQAHFGVCSDADCAICRGRRELTTVID